MDLIRLSGALLAVALPFAVAGTASADTAPSFVTLTTAAPEGMPKIVVLECDPAGGSHPNPKDACADLLLAQGDFDALSAHQEGTNCTMEYRPVVATADGTWRGHPISWGREYGNSCALRTTTGAVFQF
jgi:subtilisin inhibitor-like